MGRGHLALGTMILTVEPGRCGEGSFVSRERRCLQCGNDVFVSLPNRQIFVLYFYLNFFILRGEQRINHCVSIDCTDEGSGFINN